MAKFSLARRRVVVMASGTTILAAFCTALGPLLGRMSHVSGDYLVLPLLGLELVAFGFLMKAVVEWKRDEACRKAGE
jgi:hypothetical protein